jgi:hypothetical protein
LASRCCNLLFGGQGSEFSTAARLAIAEARCRRFALHDTAYLRPQPLQIRSLGKLLTEAEELRSIREAGSVLTARRMKGKRV